MAFGVAMITSVAPKGIQPNERQPESEIEDCDPQWIWLGLDNPAAARPTQITT